MGAVEVAILLEQIGAHAAPVPYLPTMLAISAYERNAPGSSVALRTGESIACVAWSKRPDAVTAVETGDGWRLTGRPDPTPYAPLAREAVVVAQTVDGPALFGVALDDIRSEGGPPPREPAMDITRPIGWLRFEEITGVRLGGPDAVAALLDRGAAYVAAEMLGGAQTILDMSVAYAKDRVQFGKPIGSFQAVKHRCADMLVDVEGMRSSAYWAAWAIGASDADASVAASTAKIWGSDASKRVMASGLQVHGGIGFTWEHDLHFFLKRAQLDQLSFGDASYHRERLAAMLRTRVEAGASVV
jgi:alkylation response protein AidB-like acyl-CoA dehydrogenase